MCPIRLSPPPPGNIAAMDPDTLVRDALELLIVVAVGGMLMSVLRRLWRGQLQVHRCPRCGRPTSRAFPRCRWCDAELDGP
jgi:hypothetical protein